MEKLLEIKNLTKKYHEGTSESKAVDNVSLDVERGEFVVIMGASGSGKTSLLHLIAGIDESDEGTLKYFLTDRTDGENCPSAGLHNLHALLSRGIRRKTTKNTCQIMNTDFAHMNEKAKTIFRRENIGIVFQQQCLIPDLTVYENIMLPMMLANRPASKSYPAAGKHPASKNYPAAGTHPAHRRNSARDSGKDIILSLCSQFGLEEHLWKYPSQLSGGQQQRAAILRSVVNKPPLLLCDEPTGSLNSSQTKLVMDLLNDLNQNGQTIILVTHDMKVAVRGKRVIYIEDGRIEGELRFPESEPADTGRDGHDDREHRLIFFLQKRGW